ncbi:MAG: hypothetical protein J0J14_16300, partial [Hyphomicrobium sp.]|nr:hypothetical protein [Hyphomicrobium sp.]
KRPCPRAAMLAGTESPAQRFNWQDELKIRIKCGRPAIAGQSEHTLWLIDSLPQNSSLVNNFSCCLLQFFPR